MNKKYILTIDQGTTSTRSIIFDQNGKIVGLSQMEFSQICRKSGWVEHNPEEIFETVVQTMVGSLKNANLSWEDIKGIGITNQRETTIIWDKKTGIPIHNAICWQSRQSQSICEKWKNEGIEELVFQKTGLLINPYFSASKIVWLLKNVKGAYEKALNGELLFGTIDSYLVWKLSNQKYHITDVSNASRTLLFNINNVAWDDELLTKFDIPKNILPKVVDTSGINAYSIYFKGYEIPIAAIVGDQQASLFGQCCFEKGDTKSTYGTGCFILMNTKNQLILSKKGLLSTVAWKIKGKVEYALEGSVFVAGSAIQWLRDGLDFFEKSSDCEKMIRTDGSNGVYLVPAFVGLGTPYWDNDARGAIFGITRASTKEHITVAALEAIAYQACDVMEVMQEEAASPIQYLGVDGGASVNNYLMQFQADIMNTKLIRPMCHETTALGAMYLAGLALGVYTSLDEIKNMHQVEQVFVADEDDAWRNKKIKGWKKAVYATMQYK